MRRAPAGSAGVAEAGWENADDLVRLLIDADRTAHSAWIARKVAAPQAVADHRGRCETGHTVFKAKQSPNLRLDAERREVIGARQDDFQALRPGSTGHVYAAAASTGDVFEHTGAVSKILQLGQRVQNAAQAEPRLAESDFDQTLG